MIEIVEMACPETDSDQYFPGFSISHDKQEVFRACFPGEGLMGANEALDVAGDLLKEPGFLDEIGQTLAQRINQISGQAVRIIRLEG